MKKMGTWLAGAAAGAVNGLFGAGGGMVLLPMLERNSELQEHEIFASCVSIILPICMVSVGVYLIKGGGILTEAIPYLIGGAIGGIIAGLTLKRLSAVWLHRALGLLILWGGYRLLTR